MKIRRTRILKSHLSGVALAKSGKGIVLVVVLVFTLILTILGFSVLSVASSEAILAQKDVDKTKAFYLAEAGLEIFSAKLASEEIKGNQSGSIEGDLGEGSYRVDYSSDGNAIATGIAGGQEKRVKVAVTFLAPPYEKSIYAGGFDGTAWTLMLRGTGSPVNKGGSYVGGKDTINGNVFIDGDVRLYEQSSVKPAPLPNTYNLDGDVDATGHVNHYDSSSISGVITEGAEMQDAPDLVSMNYAVNNTYNVAQIFTAAGVSSGYLPAGNELRDVFVKNPSDRKAECDTTSGNDFFFEPSKGFVVGGPFTGDTPLHAGGTKGTTNVYYVDGDVWVDSKPTYGFKMDGKVTIVATGNIHVCDNVQYKDPSKDMLGLVALGKYDGSGQLVSGGNIYFGDPGYGNMGRFDAMMFAANNFLYNIDPIGGTLKEPDSGCTILGNLSALNEVSIDRDWYTKGGTGSNYRPCRYDTATGKWVDAKTGTVLTAGETGTGGSKIRHYQMIINYDDRVRNRSTQPPSLPRGVGLIYSGLSNWEELP